MDRDMKQRYVEGTLALIDVTASLREVNLRAVSRRLGCAHTNAYNYFRDFDELLWHALAAAVERLMTHSLEAIQEVKGKERRFRRFIASQVEFAWHHPAWYRLIWIDQLGSDPPGHLLSTLSQPGPLFGEQLATMAPRPLTSAEVSRIAEVLHNYLHGVLTKVAANRVAQEDMGRLARRTATMSWRVFTMLCNSGPG